MVTWAEIIKDEIIRSYPLHYSDVKILWNSRLTRTVEFIYLGSYFVINVGALSLTIKVLQGHTLILSLSDPTLLDKIKAFVDVESDKPLKPSEHADEDLD